MTGRNYSTADTQARIKHCNDCDTTKEIGEFRFVRDRRSAGYYMSRCRLCDNEYKRNLEARKREERDFMRLIATVGKPPCDSCPSMVGCVSECDAFKAYAKGGAA